MIASEIWATCCILLLIWGSKYDLYSKSKVKINQEEVKPYYLSLTKKVNLYFIYIDMLNYNFFYFFWFIFIFPMQYFPEKLKWWKQQAFIYT